MSDMPCRTVNAGMGAGMESVSSSMGFLPMNSEAFAGNFAGACAEPGDPHKRAQATGAESPLYVGNLGKYVQVGSRLLKSMLRGIPHYCHLLQQLPVTSQVFACFKALRLSPAQDREDPRFVRWIVSVQCLNPARNAGITSFCLLTRSNTLTNIDYTCRLGCWGMAHLAW